MSTPGAAGRGIGLSRIAAADADPPLIPADLAVKAARGFKFCLGAAINLATARLSTSCHARRIPADLVVEAFRLDKAVRFSVAGT